MKQSVYCLFHRSQSQSVRKALSEGLEAYSQVNFAISPSSIIWVQSDTGTPWFEGGKLHNAVAAIPPGSKVVCPNLNALASNSKDLREGIGAAMANGLELHCVGGIFGPLSKDLNALMIGLDFARPVEEALATEQQLRKAESKEWGNLFEQYQRDLAKEWIAKYGFPSGGGITKVPVPSQVTDKINAQHKAEWEAKLGNVDLSTLGGYLRGLRETKGLTQKDLSLKLAVHDSAISKLEQGHSNPKQCFNALLYLDEAFAKMVDIGGPEGQEAARDERFLSQWARSRSATLRNASLAQ